MNQVAYPSVEADTAAPVAHPAVKLEAIANADAHTNNACIPLYSELVELLRAAVVQLYANDASSVLADTATGMLMNLPQTDAPQLYTEEWQLTNIARDFRVRVIPGTDIGANNVKCLDVDAGGFVRINGYQWRATRIEPVDLEEFIAEIQVCYLGRVLTPREALIAAGLHKDGKTVEQAAAELRANP